MTIFYNLWGFLPSFSGQLHCAALGGGVREAVGGGVAARARGAGTNCIKIGLPGKLILSKRKGLREVIFS